jgi:hypothetical protein
MLHTGPWDVSPGEGMGKKSKQIGWFLMMIWYKFDRS